ncbi:MAG: hypothetical protein IPF92_09410 [Myxococcales bacterium]|jgi:hypothetical protein|nr:hypothetical protein [Myxococcales bacterium]MBL0193046.1 hypothetical protein [Myxococcales bacterium]HQY62983.1 hypothetical protein [Polyangiaceae bacterium]
MSEDTGAAATSTDPTASSWHLAWSRGGFARFVKVSDTALTLSSTVPSPPGSRIDATFVDAPQLGFRVKIHASRRQPDGTFVLEGRPIDLTREVRAHALALMAAPPPAAG